MNILQINTIDKKGGAARIAYDLIKELEKKNHTVKMFVAHKFSKDKNVFLIKPENKLLNLISNYSQKIFKKDISQFFKSKFYYLIANDVEIYQENTEQILNTEEFRQADIVHFHNLHGLYFNLETIIKISKLKLIVWTLHDMWSITGHCAHSLDCEKWQTVCNKCDYLNIYQKIFWDNSKYLWQKKKEIYNKCDNLNIITPSLWLKNKLEKSILKDHNINLIHNGIDVGKFKKYNKKETRQELNLPFNKMIILTLADGGHENNWKGWQYTEKLIKYFKSNKDILFLNIGSNEEKEEGNIRFIKYVKDKNILAKYYSASDIFLFSSIAENSPLVILEAMSCGLPIVSFDVGGVKGVLEHKKNGYIAKYKNSDDLIRGIKYILNLSKEEIKKIENLNNFKIKNNFSLDIMTEKYLEFYNRILQK